MEYGRIPLSPQSRAVSPKILFIFRILPGIPGTYHDFPQRQHTHKQPNMNTQSRLGLNQTYGTPARVRGGGQFSILFGSVFYPDILLSGFRCIRVVSASVCRGISVERSGASFHALILWSDKLSGVLWYYIKTYQCPLAGRQVGYIYQRYQDVSGSYQCRGLSAAYRIL